jgi:hypothetical protein
MAGTNKALYDAIKEMEKPEKVSMVLEGEMIWMYKAAEMDEYHKNLPEFILRFDDGAPKKIFALNQDEELSKHYNKLILDAFANVEEAEKNRDAEWRQNIEKAIEELKKFGEMEKCGKKPTLAMRDTIIRYLESKFILESSKRFKSDGKVLLYCKNPACFSHHIANKMIKEKELLSEDKSKIGKIDFGDTPTDSFPVTLEELRKAKEQVGGMSPVEAMFSELQRLVAFDEYNKKLYEKPDMKDFDFPNVRTVYLEKERLKRKRKKIISGTCFWCEKKFNDLIKHSKEKHPNLMPRSYDAKLKPKESP